MRLAGEHMMRSSATVLGRTLLAPTGRLTLQCCTGNGHRVATKRIPPSPTAGVGQTPAQSAGGWTGKNYCCISATGQLPLMHDTQPSCGNPGRERRAIKGGRVQRRVRRPCGEQRSARVRQSEAVGVHLRLRRNGNRHTLPVGSLTLRPDHKTETGTLRGGNHSCGNWPWARWRRRAGNYNTFTFCAIFFWPGAKGGGVSQAWKEKFLRGFRN